MRSPSVPVRIVVVAVLLALALAGLVAREGMARAAGREVVLAITGFDPRSLLTGHYVRFQFRSEYPGGTPCPPGAGGYSRRPGAWVALKREGDHHAAAGVGLSREAAAKLGDLVVRGDIDCLSRTPPETTWVELNLGLDRLHADQAEAEAIQKVLVARRDAPGAAYAVVSIGNDGKARLKGLVVAGRRTNLDWY